MASISQISINGTDYAIAGTDTDPAAELLLSAYPVGAIYMSTVSTSPAELFGGTWTQIKDKFLLAAGSTYTAGATGGAATVTLSSSQIGSHSHTFTAKGSVTSTFTGTAASHTHTYYMRNRTKNGTSGSDHAYASGTTSCTTGSTSITPKGTVTSTFTGSSATTSSTGGSSAHNNMPPYYTVYMWQRTA